MRVLGIDVGLRHTGYAVIDGMTLVVCGVYSSDDKLSFSLRLKELYDSLKLLIQKEVPEVAVYETVFYGQNARTLSILAHVRGVLLLAAQESEVKIKEYTPTEIKKAVSGNGRASKYQVHGMVERLLGMKLSPSSDIGDAVACALCYVLRNGR